MITKAEILSIDYDKTKVVVTLESKVFGIGLESYTVGSAECLPERTAEQWIYNNNEKPTWKPKTD